MKKITHVSFHSIKNLIKEWTKIQRPSLYAFTKKDKTAMSIWDKDRPPSWNHIGPTGVNFGSLSEVDCKNDVGSI